MTINSHFPACSWLNLHPRQLYQWLNWYLHQGKPLKLCVFRLKKLLSELLVFKYQGAQFWNFWASSLQGIHFCLFTMQCLALSNCIWMLMTFLILPIFAGFNGTWASWSALLCLDNLAGVKLLGGWGGCYWMDTWCHKPLKVLRPCIFSISASPCGEGWGSRWDNSPCMWEHFISPLWSVNLGPIPRRVPSLVHSGNFGSLVLSGQGLQGCHTFFYPPIIMKILPLITIFTTAWLVWWLIA
jgi:hypothetical protein